MDEESNRELAFLETYSNVIMERSLVGIWKPKQTGQ